MALSKLGLLWLFFTLILSVHAAIVTTWPELQECVRDPTELECILPASTTIFFTTPVYPNHNVTIRGSGGSVIDLSCSTRMMKTNYFITIMDLEVKNGFADDGGAFLDITQGGSLNLTRVSVNNMTSTTYLPVGAAIITETATGSMTDVTFKNSYCTSSEGCIGAASILLASSWRFDNISFIDCGSSKGSRYGALRIYTAPTARITFARQILVSDSTPGLYSTTAAVDINANAGATEVLSDPIMPSEWVLNTSMNGIGLISVTNFTAKSITARHTGPSSVQSASFFALSLGGRLDRVTNVDITDSIISDGLGALGGDDSSGPPNIRIGASILSTNSRARQALYFTRGSLYVPRIDIQGASTQGAELSNSATITASEVSISAKNGTVLKMAGATINTRTLKLTASLLGNTADRVQGMEVSGVNTINARDLAISHCLTDSYGAGLFTHIGSSLLLNMTGTLVFFNNAGATGGAIYASNDSSLSVPDGISTVFDSNSASIGAAFVTSSDRAPASLFATASFINNRASTAGCTVVSMDACPSFNFTGLLYNNTQDGSSTGCLYPEVCDVINGELPQAPFDPPVEPQMSPLFAVPSPSPVEPTPQDIPSTPSAAHRSYLHLVLVAKCALLTLVVAIAL